MDSFHAVFDIDGISYSVNRPYYTIGDIGMNRLIETVNTIIQNDAADFSVLPDIMP